MDDELKSKLAIGRTTTSSFNTFVQKKEFVDPGGEIFEGSIHKAFIPKHIYKPAFGYPRSDDVVLLRKLGQNAYVHSIVSTIQFQVSSTEWEIVPKNDNIVIDESEIEAITSFFENPNGNSESFNYLLRAVVKDILELDSGIWVKVFDGYGKFKQLFARDGASFLKNPDIHGYLGDRDEFIYDSYFVYNADTGQYDKVQAIKEKDDLIAMKDRAAYWQYGWTAASIPVPFGRRELIWMSAWPQTDGVYGRSPLSVLGDVLYTILYGASFNLDMYVNNNIPDGVIQLIGANRDDIRAFRERWEAQFVTKDIFDNRRKTFFKFPITNTEAKFTPFVFNSKDMEILEQQKWFWKILLACFGVTSSEMGFTEDSNKATEIVQSAVSKRKSIQPILDIIEYHINMQIIPELNDSKKYKFQWKHENLQDDLAKAQLNQLYIGMGVKSVDMVAEELGIDLNRLHTDKQKEQKEIIAKQELLQNNDFSNPANDPSQQNDETKSLSSKDELLPGLDEYFIGSNMRIKEALATLRSDVQPPPTAVSSALQYDEQ